MVVQCLYVQVIVCGTESSVEAAVQQIFALFTFSAQSQAAEQSAHRKAFFWNMLQQECERADMTMSDSWC
jgi:hypothetical protein